MTRTFASVAQALAANVKEVRLSAFLGGVPIDCFEAHSYHDVDQSVATCTAVLDAPLSTVPTNKQLLVQAGYPGAVRTIFKGRIPADGATLDESGRTARLSAVGNASLLDYREKTDLVFSGSISLKRLFQALCKRRGVPSYHSDDVLSPDGEVIQLGGVADVDDGRVILERTVSPLQWLSEKVQLFGYRIFDCPNGQVRQTRISGIPSGVPGAIYAEGVDCYRVSRDTNTDRMVTYWEVFGAEYSDSDGRVVAIRSIPDSVPYSPELDPPGYRRDERRDGSLVTQQLADAARNVLEIAYGAPYELATWEVDGAPDRQPGDVVQVQSDICGVSGLRWLMSIDQSVSENSGYYATMTGWAGAGSALPVGDDCIASGVGSQTYHVGNESLSYYEDPTPDGTFLKPEDPVRTVVISITVPDDYSSLTIEGAIHGSNQHLAGNANEDSTASMFEVWQLPDPTLPGNDSDNKLRKVGDGQLPILEEQAGANFAGDLELWNQVVMPLTGSLKAGAAELHLTSGLHAPSGDYDDYEVKNMSLIACGIGQPDLPDEVD